MRINTKALINIRKSMFLLFLLCFIPGFAGCSGLATESEGQQEILDKKSAAGDEGQQEIFEEKSMAGDEGQSEISEVISTAGAGMEAGQQQSLDTEETQEPEQDGSNNGQDVKEELEIHFLDVGQGDSTLLVCGGEAMLIDAGNNDQGTKIQNYLQKQGVETLKYVVCTHPDADHIGGMDVILYKFDCETIFMTDEEKDTNTYRDVIDTMKSKGYKAVPPALGERYSLGDAEFVIVGPVSESGTDKSETDGIATNENGTDKSKTGGIGTDRSGTFETQGNNNCIAILVIHGENRFLFTGDAEEEEEEEMVQGLLSLEADVYKVGHHGSRTSSSKVLLEAVKPSYAVISCGVGNSYGHPHAETLNNLRAMGIKLYRTDEQGSIILTSDGQEITWNCSPSENWTPGEPKGNADTRETAEPSANTTEQESASDRTEEIRYICNINTMKFHYPDCSSVEQMKESNKLPVSDSREELIGQGYEPCKRCKP